MHRARQFLAQLGPGLVTGAADDAFSGVVTPSSLLVRGVVLVTILCMAGAAVGMFALQR